MSGGGSRLWMCEMRAEMRASGDGEVASTFHVTRTRLSLVVALGSVGGIEVVESTGIHLLMDESNLCHGWKVGVASVWPAGKGTPCHHWRDWFRTREYRAISVIFLKFLCLLTLMLYVLGFEDGEILDTDEDAEVVEDGDSFIPRSPVRPRQPLKQPYQE